MRGDGTTPLARSTKAKIRNIMNAICSHAIRYGWMKYNPIIAVRQSAKRQIEPEALEPEELQRLIGALGTRERVLIMLDLPTGMRVSELLALQWDDIVSKGSRSPFARPSGTSILVPSRRKGASG